MPIDLRIQHEQWRQFTRTVPKQVVLLIDRSGSRRAAIVDSQTVKTTEKGGYMAVTLGRKAAVASRSFKTLFQENEHQPIAHDESACSGWSGNWDFRLVGA
jgi:hypothetical protein